MIAKTSNMKLAILGGSFNPPHLGHIYIAETACAALEYDTVIFVPSHISAHKDDFSGVTPDQCLKMLHIALEKHENFKIDTCDLKRGGISYSINTIEYIYKNYTFTGKPGFIIGDDLLEGFSKWKEVEKLKNLIDLIVVRRKHRPNTESPFPDFYLDNKVMEISSTEIRNMLKEGKDIKKFINPIVLLEIEKNGYYR